MDDRRVPLEVKVWGELACFTRPELKVERVTYPVITPSAARGVLEAILWRPAFSWRVQEIHVLKPIQYASFLRNEVNSKASVRGAQRWEHDGDGFDASEVRVRAQRHTVALRDVAYLIRAQIILRPGVEENPAKYRDQFRRRVRDGRCFATPYLGCREFAAAFSDPDAGERPIDLSEDLGLMLLDLDYAADGRGTPRFFQASLARGVLRVPSMPNARVA